MDYRQNTSKEISMSFVLLQCNNSANDEWSEIKGAGGGGGLLRGEWFGKHIIYKQGCSKVSSHLPGIFHGTCKLTFEPLSVLFVAKIHKMCKATLYSQCLTYLGNKIKTLSRSSPQNHTSVITLQYVSLSLFEGTTHHSQHLCAPTSYFTSSQFCVHLAPVIWREKHIRDLKKWSY